ncbi:hypothetical protein MY1884_008961 [Beauveria asiatica]
MAPKAVLTRHNKKQKEAARKRGPSLKSKTQKLGLKANIPQLAHTAPKNVYDVPDDDGGRVLSESASREASSVEYNTGGQTSDGAADAGATDNKHESNSAVGERSTEALLPVAKGDHVDSVEDMPSIEDSELLGDTWFINDMTDFGAGIEEMGSDDLLEAIEGMEEGTFSDMPMIDQMLQLQLVDQAGTPPQPAREEGQAKGSSKPNSLADSRARRLSLARAEAEAWTYWARHTRPLLWGW